MQRSRFGRGKKGMEDDPGIGVYHLCEEELYGQCLGLRYFQKVAP